MTTYVKVDPGCGQPLAQNILGYTQFRVIAYNVDGKGGALVEFLGHDGKYRPPEICPWDDLKEAICGDEDNSLMPPYREAR